MLPLKKSGVTKMREWDYLLVMITLAGLTTVFFYTLVQTDLLSIKFEESTRMRTTRFFYACALKEKWSRLT